MLKIVVLIMAVVLLAGGGFFAWSKLRAEDGGNEAAHEHTDEEEHSASATRTLSLGEFLVNVRSSDATLRYLQTEISIVVAAPEGEEEPDDGHHAAGDAETHELPPASHRYARDVAIEVLSTQSFERLRDQSDRSKLKATLQQKLDAALSDHQVQDVLFTAFVMQ
jgi:flagellar basal body-associated protein FliL